MSIEAWLAPRIKTSNVSIQSSDLGGLGLFYNGPLPESDIELATISKDSIFDYELLLETLLSLKTKEPPLSEIIIGFLTNLEPETETDVLMCYIWAFVVWKAQHPDLPFIKLIDPYLELLLTTKVDIPKGDSGDEDWLMQVLAAQYQNQTQRHTIITLWLSSDISSETSWREVFTMDTCWQVYKAVKSRVLEIPHAVNENLGDFVTNVSLVPFLDFCNHLAQNNAYFDVDRSTGDVILKLAHNRVQKSPIEVTISYAPVETTLSFLLTYGFIPQSAGQLQVFDWKFSNFDQQMNRFNETQNKPYQLIGKWLKVIPAVQLVLRPAGVAMNLASNPLGLFFTQGLLYNTAWPEQCGDENLRRLLETQESNFDVIHSPEPLGPIGVLVNEQPFEAPIDTKAPAIVQKTLLFLEEAAKEELKKTFPSTTYHDFKRQILQKVVAGVEADYIEDLSPIYINQIEL